MDPVVKPKQNMADLLARVRQLKTQGKCLTKCANQYLIILTRHRSIRIH